MWGTGPQHSLTASLEPSLHQPLGRTPLLRALSVPQPSLPLASVTATGTSQPRRERAAELTAGSGPRPHPHLPFCSCSADIILFQDLAFTLKSHHCHQGRNVIIFALKMWFLRPFSFLRCSFLSKPLCICVHTVREKASDTKWELVMWELLGLSGNMVRMW